jgi:hypothetical protein
MRCLCVQVQANEGYLVVKVHKVWVSQCECSWFLRYLADVCELETRVVRWSTSRVNYVYYCVIWPSVCNEL